jgi:[acyl-carrier-protein] S-malonyltransferase
MQPAADGLQRHLETVHFHDPRFPVIANVTAQPIRSVSPLRDELTQQVRHAVRWRQSVELMVDAGVRTFVEIGPGGVLTGLVKSIAKDVKPTLLTLSDVDTVRASA